MVTEQTSRRRSSPSSCDWAFPLLAMQMVLYFSLETGGSLAGYEGTDELERVRTAARLRDASLTQLRVHYRVRVEGSSAAKESGMLDHVITDFEEVFAMKGQKCRAEVLQPGSPVRNRVAVYNGQVCKIWRPNEGNAVVQIPVSANAQDCSYLSSVFFPYGEEDKFAIEKGDFTFTLLRTLEQDAWRILPVRENVDGVSCVVVERGPLEKVFVDPDRSYTLIKREYAGPKKQKRITQMYQLRSIAPHAWLPAHVETKIISIANPDAWLKQSFEVLELATDVPDSLFTLSFPPGTVVSDNIARMVYQVPAPGEHQLARSITASSQMFRRGRSVQAWLVPISLALIGILVASYFMVRKRA